MQTVFSIAAVAKRIGIKPSAVRYYERVGLLMPVPRVRGQRRYDAKLLHRLSLIHCARGVGFSIDEVRKLLHGYPADATPPTRWTELSKTKVDELQQLIDHLTRQQESLRRLQGCGCTSLDMCGERMLHRTTQPVKFAKRTPPSGRTLRP